MATTQAVENNSTPTVVKKTYGDVVLTLQNCLLPPEKLSPTPSSLDGLSADDENDIRILGCELIQTAGILLKLPQVAMATGQVLFHRFYYSKSLIKHGYETVAIGCVCLASKIEEAPRRMRDVINVFHHIRQVRNGKTIQPMILDQNYLNLKNQVIKAERRVLKELGFCVHVKHPHKIIVMYLQVLQLEKNRPLVQRAWNYMNDGLRTNVFVRYSPETIACACIYLSARELQVALPTRPGWWLVLGSNEQDIQQVCYTMLRLYTRSKPDQDRLEQVVEVLKKKLEDAKLKAKGIINNNNTTLQVGANFSPNSRSSRSNSPVKNDRSPDVKKERSKQLEPSSPKRETNHVTSRNKQSSPDSGRSDSKSHSPSPPPPKRKGRSRSPRGYKNSRRSRSPIHHSSSHKHSSRKRSPSPHRNSKKDKRNKDKRYKSRSRTRSRDRHESKSHKSSRNGHRRSRSQERSRR